jgi:hypothetical protein
MAKFSSTTFGQISGKHGTAVAAHQNGQNILKVYTKPGNPRSIKQLTQRAKFAAITKGMSPLRAVINEGFQTSVGYNRSISAALSNAVKGSYPKFELDYAKVIVSNGLLHKTEKASCVKKTGTVVTVNWDATLFSGGSKTDDVNLLFYNPLSRNTFVSKAVAKRSAATVEVTLPAVWAGANTHCWIYFTSALTGDNSASLYISSLTL